MADQVEMLRSELMTNLSEKLNQDQLKDILATFDMIAAQYEVNRKPMQLIVTGGLPEVAKYFIAAKSIENCSKSTLSQYRYKLIDFFKTVCKPYTEITTNDIRLYLNHYKCAHGITDSTVATIRSILNSFFQWCTDNEYLVRNPVTKIENIKFQAKEREPLTSYELEILRWNCQTLREKALVDFLFSTGCRVSECSKMDLSDLNWQERSAVVQHGKGDKRRIVFFNAECEVSLKKYLELRDDDCEALFVCTRKPYKRLSPRSIEIEISRIAGRCDIKAFPHKLRHTFATTGIHSGMPLERLQALMGHANPRTTLIYAKIGKQDLKYEHQKAFT